MFSVVIPLYNKQFSIENTIQSVLQQTYDNFELLIINDGSTDNSIKVISDIKDDRIRIIHKENGGVSSARNLGIKEAKNKWIALLDGDDLWKENHLKNIYNAIQNNPEIHFIGTGYSVARKDGTVLKNIQIDKEGAYNFFEISLKIRFVVHTSCVAFNKEQYSDLYFDENLSTGEDLKYWEQLALQSSVYLIPEITSIYIDDSENKAVYKPHPLEKTHVYTINTKNITDISQKKYYNNLILHNIFLVFERHQTLKNAFKIYLKHVKFIGVKGFFYFVSGIVSKRL